MSSVGLVGVPLVFNVKVPFDGAAPKATAVALAPSKPKLSFTKTDMVTGVFSGVVALSFTAVGK